MYPKPRALQHQLRTLDQLLRNQSVSTYVDALTALLVAYPSDVATEVLGLLQAKDYLSLIRWADSYSGALHATAKDAFLANQLAALIKKYPFPIPGIRKYARDAAMDKFLAAEKRCQRYNLKFHRLNSGRWSRDEDTLQRMSHWIAYVIGYQPDLAAIYSECGHGPGASIGVHGQNTNMARKFLAKDWSCSPSALPYAISALAQDQHVWELLNPDTERPVCFDFATFSNEVTKKVRLVNYNNIVFVPKTTIVDRTIAVEPLLNGYVQKGVDSFMKRRLKHVGLDLYNQEVNQDLARQGSIPGQPDPFVTIDLSSASDSISTEVVKRLLPPDWFDLLNSLRSKKYKLEGEEIRYEKFVSMGNGFCFPLETLIFASVCQRWSQPGDFIVYGDDIIVRQSVATQVIKTLWSLGFRHNSDKTFLEGPFRESCGADWFEGLDIRPLTLDYAFDSLENVIKFHNLSLQKPLWASCFEKVREYLFEKIPFELRLQRPFPGVVYSAFEVPLDRFLSSTFARWNREIRAWSWLEIERRASPDKEIASHGRYSTALMMGALLGSLSTCPFAKRRKTSRTVRPRSHAGATSLWLPPK